MTIILRPRQVQFLADLRVALKNHSVVVACAPTGFGKTVISAAITQSAVGKQRRVIMTVHRSYLVDQTKITFDKFGIKHGLICAGAQGYNPYKPAQIASIDTLVRRLDRIKPPDLLLVDEGHHAVSASWRKVIEWVVAAGGQVLLFSATPERLDGRGLGELAGHIVEGPTTEWLIENGDLCKYRAYAPTAPDLEGVRTVAGDFNQEDLGKLMDRNALIGDMVHHWRQFANGMKSVYFAVSIAHSRHIADTFTASGVPALHIDGDTPPAERFAAARALANGSLKILTNCSLVSEGADLAAWAGKDVSIECVGLARPTKSVAMHLQQIGRALRNSAGKSHAVILDHAGNLASLGLPDDPREWSLEGRSKAKKGAAEPASPVRVCLGCFATFTARLRACPHCGKSIDVQARKIEHVEGDLQEVDKEALRRARKQQEHAAKNAAELAEIGRHRGYQHPERWAAKLWTVRQQARQKSQEALRLW